MTRVGDKPKPIVDATSLPEIEPSTKIVSSDRVDAGATSYKVPDERVPLAKRFPAAARAFLSDDKLQQVADHFGGAVSDAIARITKAPKIAPLVPSSLRPEPPITGRIERSLKRGRQRVLFRPYDKDISPFPLTLDATWGLRSGAEVQIVSKTDAAGKATQQILSDPSDFGRAFVGEIAEVDGRWVARGFSNNRTYDEVPLDEDSARDAASIAGQAVLVEVSGRGTSEQAARVEEVLGPVDGAKARFLATATDHGLSLKHPEAVMAEVRELQKEPITGKSFEHLPFVSIDGKDTVDLDQAVCVEERPGGGTIIHYAIADAAHYVREGSALDQEARRRSLTAYLPGRSLPVLPRELSEDLCSLNAGQRRRAFIVSMELDARGELVDTSFERGVIRSRAKLDFEGVQEFMDTGKGPLADQEYSRSLELLKSLGIEQVAKSAARGVVDNREREERASPDDGHPSGFAMKTRTSLPVEKYNEQVSLLANRAVAEKLNEAGVLALHRAHVDPDPRKLTEFRARVKKLGLPWPRGQELAAYLAGLDDADPRTRAISRMATRTNRRANYVAKSPGHYGLKLKAYLHFTAPMRRYPDIVAARVLAALVEGTPIPHQDEEELKRIADANDRAARIHGTIGSECASILQAIHLEPRLGETVTGFVVDASPGGFKVYIDDPPGDLYVSSGVMQKAQGGQYGLVDDQNAFETPAGVFGLGEAIDLRIVGVDRATGTVDVVPAAFGAERDIAAA